MDVQLKTALASFAQASPKKSQVVKEARKLATEGRPTLRDRDDVANLLTLVINAMEAKAAETDSDATGDSLAVAQDPSGTDDDLAVALDPKRERSSATRASPVRTLKGGALAALHEMLEDVEDPVAQNDDASREGKTEKMTNVKGQGAAKKRGKSRRRKAKTARKVEAEMEDDE